MNTFRAEPKQGNKEKVSIGWLVYTVLLACGSITTFAFFVVMMYLDSRLSVQQDLSTGYGFFKHTIWFGGMVAILNIISLPVFAHRYLKNFISLVCITVAIILSVAYLLWLITIFA